MKDNILYYSVGALLYAPANKENIANSVINERFGKKFSLALCLEDTINDNFVLEAEHKLVHSINTIYTALEKKTFYLPKIFIRVRNHTQIPRLTDALGQSIELITGYIIPKFSVDTADLYIKEITAANEKTGKNLYVMPIYESSSIIDLKHRYEILYKLKNSLSEIESLVLNIRVGGNDLCHFFGFRRHSDESIHRIGPISNIFSDLVTVYGSDYVISGPVWEYYSGSNWQEGLINEINDDKLCGFTGKTIIHPNQIPVVNNAYAVSESDFNDARSIAEWNENSDLLVSASASRERMNEYKTHINWAKRTLFLAQTFGVK